MRMLRRLFFGASFLTLSIASLYCLALITGFSATHVLSATPVPSSAPVTADEIVAEDMPGEETPEQTAPAAETSKPVEAAADQTVKGKIIRKTVDSSGANLKYNRIYVKNGTSKTVDLKTELLAGVSLRLADTKEPQVLIVHTHTTECYLFEQREYYTASDKTRSTNDSENVVAVGEVLKAGLEKKGIGVVHAAEKHDYPEYTGSYNRAADTINRYLKKYPTIRVVIDLHRDSITADDGSKTAVVTEIDGRSAAQVMLVAGCEDGSVTGFPNWRDNFRLAIKLQQTMEVMYPSLARPILFTPRKYNLHLTTGSLLIECGTEANTLEEAKYSAELIAAALASTLHLL